MSTIWTPSGERPVSRQPDPAPQAAPPGSGGGRPPVHPDEPTEEELRAHLEEIGRQLLDTPASVVVANHCIGLFQLAALHLEQDPPDLAEAKLAIDAFGAIVEALGPRLGEEEIALREAVTQLQLAYVQRQAGGIRPPG